MLNCEFSLPRLISEHIDSPTEMPDVSVVGQSVLNTAKVMQ